MARRGVAGWSSSLFASSSNNKGVSGGSDDEGGGGTDLPIIDCPQCFIPVLKLMSGTPENRGKWFYKCPNHHKVNSRCPEGFFKWEAVYEGYLKEIARKEKNFGNSTSELKLANPRHDDKKIKNEGSVYELMCGIQQTNAEILCIVNSNSRLIGNIVAVGVTCGLFVILMSALLLVVVLKLM